MSEIEDNFDDFSAMDVPEPSMPQEYDGNEPESDILEDSIRSADAGLHDSDVELTETVMELRRRVEDVESAIPQNDQNPKVFIANVTDNTFEEICIVNGTLNDYTGGRSGTGTLLGANRAIVIETDDPPQTGFAILPSDGLNGKNFPVYVKATGVDGSGFPVYSAYLLTDPGMTTAIGTSLEPKLSRWRGASGISITAATDGSVGMAHYEVDGTTVALDAVAETVCTVTTTYEVY